MLIDTFINAVYLYDNKIVIGFNHKEGTKTVTFDEVKEAIPEENGSDLDCLGAPKPLKTLRFRGFFPFGFAVFRPDLHTRFFPRFLGGNLVARIRVDASKAGIRKDWNSACEEFLRHCRIRNLSPHTAEYYVRYAECVRAGEDMRIKQADGV